MLPADDVLDPDWDAPLADEQWRAVWWMFEPEVTSVLSA